MGGEDLLLALLIWTVASALIAMLIGAAIARLGGHDAPPRPATDGRPRQTNANVIKFPRRKRQFHGARLPEPPEPPEAA